MANVKNGAFREIIIDRCLQSRKGYSTQDIFNKCNAALERRGDPAITALNTIRNDILNIKNRWHVEVEQIRSGREIKYRYRDSTFSIYNNPFNEDDLVQLMQSVSVLRRFEGMPGFEWIEEMSAHLQIAVSANLEPVIGFDENQKLKGMEFFTPLFNAITEKQTLNITYQTYKNKTIVDIVHPYYLKEYNQRWFLFALNDKHKNISIFAIDRIEEIDKASKKFIPNTTIDFKHYFDNIVGVSVNPNDDILQVMIWVDKEQLPYIISKPIHKTQTVIEKREDGSAVISIEVIPTYELIQLLLSFADHIKILSPDTLRGEILCRIKKNIENYK